jgi:hypothetical protein
MIEIKQELKDMVTKEYGYSVLDMLSTAPYRDVADYLKGRMNELKPDCDFEEVKDITVWASDLDAYKRRAYIYHTYVSTVIKYEFGDSLK